jgi:hypothetical protein
MSNHGQCDKCGKAIGVECIRCSECCEEDAD